MSIYKCWYILLLSYLLGIDTPERGEELFEEAKEYLMLVEREEVEILRDWEDKGKYGRDLRYIFYNNRLINIELLERGLAVAFIFDKLKYEDKILIAEQFAQDKCVGVWANTGDCS